MATMPLEPNTFEEPIQNPDKGKWVLAMKDEMQEVIDTNQALLLGDFL